MAVTALRPAPKFQAFDLNGDPLAGGKLYTYSAGTTTALATYTDSTGTVANANPVVLDSRGEASVWFQPLNYKVVLKDSNDNTIWTQDNYSGSPFPITDEWITYVHTWTYISATQVSVPGDQTAIYTVNKAVRAVCTAGTFYGTLTNAAYDGSTKTTLTVSFESGSFDSGVAGSSTISIGVQSSESPALTYATAAAASAAAAAASYDSFDDRYLGAKASDPTLDNDGNALIAGALYWNTASSVMKAYTGSAWVVSYNATPPDIPLQSGHAGKFLKTDGTTLSWGYSGINGYAAKTGAYTLVAGDKEKLIDCTSGTFTLSLTAAATLGDSWAVYLRNSGTGDITLDPAGAETIDGLASYIMYHDEVRLVFCDGTAFRSVVIQPFFKTFTSSGTFTKPPGYNCFGGLAWSGGVSGQRTNNTATLSVGGAGGGCFPFTLAASSVAASESVTIGSGGAAVTGVANGNSGGNTSFGSLFTVYGGTFLLGGAVGVTSAFRAASSTVPYGFEAPPNSSSTLTSVWGGTNPSNDATNASGSTIYGGAAGGSVNATGTLRAPGTSKFGGNGGAASVASNGTDGTAPGGGGGATQTGTQSGAGARGELQIWGVV